MLVQPTFCWNKFGHLAVTKLNVKYETFLVFIMELAKFKNIYKSKGFAYCQHKTKFFFDFLFVRMNILQELKLIGETAPS